MKFCQPHWEKLKNAIKERGLWHLVAVDGKVALNRAKEEIEGTAIVTTFDPLMSAHWMILSRVLEAGGLYLLSGDYCPLCEVDKYAESKGEKGISSEWIKGCTDSILKYCQEQKITAGN